MPAVVALIALGKIIDNFPQVMRNNRDTRISSPAESTKLAVILFWSLFHPGAWAVLQEGNSDPYCGNYPAVFNLLVHVHRAGRSHLPSSNTMRWAEKDALEDPVLTGRNILFPAHQALFR
ncbi:MAG: hypothetical protein MZV70_30930 [Desulfobacterales bacterium]|nr:hypothetical protein [Desulfobacterales bacterium]